MASEFTRRNVLRTAAASTGTAVVSGRLWGGGPAVAATHAAGRPDPGGDAAGPLDRLDFGAPDSEAAHGLRTGPSEITDGQAGDRARVAKPLEPPTLKGGDLTFTLAVDPVHQNYLTVKFWGGDSSGYKTIAYINGEQIGYRRSGDYEALNPGTVKPLPGRFHYATVMLPLESTRGQERAEITLRTYDAAFSAPVTAASRGYHAAYTHTAAYLDVSAEPLGDFRPTTDTVPDLDEAGKRRLIDGFTAAQVTLFDDCSAKVDASANGRLSLVRYEDELRFYSSALAMAGWCPARSTAERKAALARVFKVVDNHTRDYYANTMLLARGGHQGDWGGFYGALGEALYIVENVIADPGILGRAAFEAFLDEEFTTGTSDGETSLEGVGLDGGPLTRRGAWERVLKANFDYARSRLSYIFNQVMYTYEGAWEAHEGLRVIGSPFYEGRARSHRIAGEALGWEPFLGEEVLVGPDGQDLDLFHSLFQHDTTARWTEDYRRYVVKGLARSKLDQDGNIVRRVPLGRHYTTVTEAGHTRENGYVANYGESTNYLPEWFHRTLGHRGDEALNDNILKIALRNLHARGYARHTSLDDNGKRVMRMEMVVDERNTSYPGFPGYALRQSECGRFLGYVSLARHMRENPGRYSGEEWRETWEHARAAVGFFQQQLADHQYFNVFPAVMSKIKYDLALGDTYAYLVRQPPAGVVHPQTDFACYTPAEIAALGVRPADYERFAWVDVDCVFVSMRDGDLRLFGQLNERQRGFARNGRLHVLHRTHDHVVQIRTNGRFPYEDYYARMDNIDVDFMEDQQTGDSTAPQALAGEIAPITYQPGVGTVRRENFEADHAYSGYPDLLTARYGRYLFAFNTTRAVYGNERTFTVELPAGHRGTTVLDLVSGRHLPVRAGAVEIGPKSGLVLRLSTDLERELPPAHVDFVAVLPGDEALAVTWQTTAGATHYEIRRATRRTGPFTLLAGRATGRHYLDRTARTGATYYYTVTAVNRYGTGWTSHAVRAELPSSASPGTARSGWRDDALGAARRGSTAVRGATVRILGAKGAGLGEGDDYRLAAREIEDALHYVSRPGAGSFALTARLDTHRGALTGLMLRDRLAANTRYVYFGAGRDGGLVLENRTRDSRHDWQDDRRSPFAVDLTGHTAAATPYLRLVRDFSTHRVQALVSADGALWTSVGSLFTPFPYTVHAGLGVTGDAVFSRVALASVDLTAVLAFVERKADETVVRWNKPEDALTFTLHRTTDPRTALTDPATHPGGWQTLVSGTRDLAFTDGSLRHGTRYYKVVATTTGGGTRVTAQPAEARAESLAAVLARADAVAADTWTRRSFAAFTAELARIRTAAGRPGAGEDALIDAVYAANDLLVPVDTLLRTFPVTPSMVEASTVQWPGTGTRASNGWRAFDGDDATYTDTLAAESWIDVDAGDAGPVVIDMIRLLPRADRLARADGTVVKGSDDGVAWHDLYTVSGVDTARWYEVRLERRASYRRIRIYDNHDGRCNLSGIEFAHHLPDEE